MKSSSKSPRHISIKVLLEKCQKHLYIRYLWICKYMYDERGNNIAVVFIVHNRTSSFLFSKVWEFKVARLSSITWHVWFFAKHKFLLSKNCTKFKMPSSTKIKHRVITEYFKVSWFLHSRSNKNDNFEHFTCSCW